LGSLRLEFQIGRSRFSKHKPTGEPNFGITTTTWISSNFSPTSSITLEDEIQSQYAKSVQIPPRPRMAVSIATVRLRGHGLKTRDSPRRSLRRADQ
jgi:hypothetical protein